MICVSLANMDKRHLLEAIGSCDFAEIRLDLCDVRLPDLKMVFAAAREGQKRLIATCRPGKLDEADRRLMLSQAVSDGASLVDLETGCDAVWRDQMMTRARQTGCRVMLSHHDFDGTPGVFVLTTLIAESLAAGADYVKIACRVNHPADGAVLLGLLAAENCRGRLVVVGMGEAGRIVRLAAPLLGAPFTYAAPACDNCTADGQFTRTELAELWRRLGVRS